jgi:hypothetical protein
MAQRLFRITVVGGPFDGLDQLVSEAPPDVLVRGDCRCELYDIENAEPQRWVYHCACYVTDGPSVLEAGPQAP